jgi:hypothetical protein
VVAARPRETEVVLLVDSREQPVNDKANMIANDKSWFDETTPGRPQNEPQK